MQETKWKVASCWAKDVENIAAKQKEKRKTTEKICGCSEGGDA